MKQLVILIFLAIIPKILLAQSSDSLIVDYFDKKLNEADRNDYHLMRIINRKAIELNNGVVLHPYVMKDSKDRIKYEGYVTNPDSPKYTYINKLYDRKGRIELIKIKEYQQYLSALPDSLSSYYSLIEPCLKDTFIHYTSDFALQIKKNKDGEVEHIAAVNGECCCEMTVLRFDQKNSEIVLEDKVDGEIHGRKFRYNESGLIIKKAFHINGKKEGRWEKYFANGQLYRVSSYKNGIKHGVWKKFREDGTQRYVKNYKMGVLHGAFKEFYLNGQLSSEGVYKNGLQDGKWHYYNKDGSDNYYRLFDADRALNK